MQFTELGIKGVYLIEPDFKMDNRGYFTRIFDQDIFKQKGLESNFKQWSISHNIHKGTVRGLHYQKAPYDGLDDEFGLRNITYQAFLSPADAGDIIWGSGPAMIIPTNTDDSLGNDKWSAGPAALALTIRGPWVSGVLAQHFWDFAGDSDAANVKLSTLQYFVNYNFPDFYLNTSPTMSYDWNADSDEAWTIPVGGGIGRVFRFGEMPVDMRLSAYWNVEAPDSAPDWFTEFQVKLLFPK